MQVLIEGIKQFCVKQQKDTKFDVAKLKANLSLLPSGYELKKTDSELYDKCFENPETVDFVSAFGTKEKYLELGEATEKDVIPVLDTGISFCKSLYYKEIDYRVKPDNDIFDTFSAASIGAWCCCT